MSKQQEILQEVALERVAQNAKWGIQNHQPPMWVAILGEEFGEVCKEVCDENTDQPNYRIELIQVAAVAVSMIECYDRQQME
jgi:hypothetical protein